MRPGVALFAFGGDYWPLATAPGGGGGGCDFVPYMSAQGVSRAAAVQQRDAEVCTAAHAFTLLLRLLTEETKASLHRTKFLSLNPLAPKARKEILPQTV